MLISWAFLPWHVNSFKNLSNADAFVSQMKNTITEPGIYRYPGMPAEATAAALNEMAGKYAAGPVISFMIYNPTGVPMMNPLEFVSGFIINYLSAFVAAFLLVNSQFKNKKYFARVFFVLLISVFAALVGPLIEWNWLMFPAAYSFGVALDYLITWCFADLVLHER